MVSAWVFALEQQACESLVVESELRDDELGETMAWTLVAKFASREKL